MVFIPPSGSPPAIKKSTGTAKGDLVAYAGASNPTRLAVGANGTFLVADSAIANGLKWSGLQGAKVYLSADQTNIGTNPVKVAYDTEEYDTDGNFASSTYTVPTGKGGYYLLYHQVYLYGTITDQQQYKSMIYLGGAQITDTSQPSSGTNVGLTVISFTIKKLVATNTIEFYAQAPSSANTDIYSAQTHSYGIVQQLTQD